VRVERVADGAAEVDPNPGERVWVVDREPEDEGSGRLTTPSSPRVEAIPSLPTDQKSATTSETHRVQSRQAGRSGGGALASARPSAGRSDSTQPEQGGGLVAGLMHQRGGDAVADHALAWDPYEGHGAAAAAGEPGPRTSDRRARPPVEVAEHRRRLQVPFGQAERVGGGDVQPGEPDADLVLASLGDCLVEQVELREHAQEPQPNQREPPLLLGYGASRPGPVSHWRYPGPASATPGGRRAGTPRWPGARPAPGRPPGA
jgi:hypothetical protein